MAYKNHITIIFKDEFINSVFVSKFINRVCNNQINDEGRDFAGAYDLGACSCIVYIITWTEALAGTLM